MEYERYYNEDGELGVLVSHGFGAGWSTRAHDYGIALALDKRIIEKFLEGASEDEMEKYLKSIGYTEYFYMGGYRNLELEFVPKGSAFMIHEYDGAESIQYLDDFNFVIA